MTNTATPPVIDVGVLTILKLLVRGRDLEFAADASGRAQGYVEQVARQYGWPDRDKIQIAVDEYTSTAVDRDRAALPTGSARPSQVSHAEQGPRTTPPPRPGPLIGLPSPAESLIDRAAKSSKATTRRLGEKVDGLLVDLADRLKAEEAADRAARIEAEAKSKALADVERLESQLRIARAKFRPQKSATSSKTTKKTAAKSSTVDTSVVRFWARSEGYTVGDKGMLPRDIVEAYEAAHGDHA